MLALIQIVDFHRPTVDIAWIAPSRAITCRYTDSPCSTARLHAGRAGRQNTNKLMRMRENPLIRPQNDNGVVGGNVSNLCDICN